MNKVKVFEKELAQIKTIPVYNFAVAAIEKLPDYFFETAAIKAEQQKISAEAEAEAVRIRAEAEAEANREIAASLTSELIEKLKYERWDGSVPQFSGTGVTPIVTID